MSVTWASIVNRIREVARPTFVNGNWRKAEVSAKNIARIRNHARGMGLPWRDLMGVNRPDWPACLEPKERVVRFKGTKPERLRNERARKLIEKYKDAGKQYMSHVKVRVFSAVW